LEQLSRFNVGGENSSADSRNLDNTGTCLEEFSNSSGSSASLETVWRNASGILIYSLIRVPPIYRNASVDTKYENSMAKN